MNLHAAFGGIAIGRDNSGNFRPSLRGVAVRVEKSRFVGLDNNQLLDVTPFTFDNADNVVYRVPVRKPAVGDLIVTSDAPLRVLFVQVVLDNGHIGGLDPTSGADIEYAPTANILNVRMYVKVMSLLDGMIGNLEHDNLMLLSLLAGIEGRSGTGDNILLPLLLLRSRDGPPVDRDLLPLLLLQSASMGAGGMVEALLLQELVGRGPPAQAPVNDRGILVILAAPSQFPLLDGRSLPYPFGNTFWYARRIALSASEIAFAA